MAQLKDTSVTGGLAVSGTANITGATQHNGDVTLYAASGDSPSLIFQRGTTSDTLNDYKIVDTGGHLTIKQSGNSGTSGYTQVAKLTNTGILSVSTPPATDTTPSTTAWISPTDSEVKVATDATIATGDKLIVRDTSDSNKMRSSSISFDTTNTTDYLRKDGTWATPAGGGGGDVFWVTLSYDDMEEEWSIDCSYSDISTAYTAGKAIYMKLSDYTPFYLQDAVGQLVSSHWPEFDEHTQEYVDGPFVFQFYQANAIAIIVEVWPGYIMVESMGVTTVRANSLVSTTGAYYAPLLRDSTLSYNGASDTTIDYSDSMRFRFSKGTTSTPGVSALFLGNGTNAGTNGNQYGYIAMYPQNGNYMAYILPVSTLTASRTLYLPNKSGTLATTDDITAAINALDATNTSY